MADALSYLLTNLGYLDRQERNVLRAVYGANYGPGGVQLPSTGGGMAPDTSAESAPSTGLDVSKVKSSASSPTSSATVRAPTQTATSVSGKAVHPSLTVARPSMATQTQRSVATPSGARSGGGGVVNTKLHPILRTSGSGGITSKTPDVPASGGIAGGATSMGPLTVAPSSSSSSTDTAAASLYDSGSGTTEAGGITGGATADAGASMDASTLEQQAEQTAKKFPWLVVGGGVLAVLLLRK